MSKETTRQSIQRLTRSLKELEGVSPDARESAEYRTLEREVHRLKDVLAEHSKRGKRSRNKGATYERKVAKLFREAWGIELARTPQSGGFQKGKSTNNDFLGDIVCLEEGKDFRLHVECKNAKTLSVPKWTRQAEEDCPEGKIPAVIFHREGTDRESIVLDLADFLRIVDTDAVIKMESDSHAGTAEGAEAALEEGDVRPVQERPRKRRIRRKRPD